MNAVAILPMPSNATVKAWARFCAKRPDVSVSEYLEGFILLKGPAAAEWLARGFDDVLRAVRNSKLP